MLFSFKLLLLVAFLSGCALIDCRVCPSAVQPVLQPVVQSYQWSAKRTGPWNKQYIVVHEGGKTLEEAKAFCKAQDGHLPEIESQEENDAIFHLTDNTYAARHSLFLNAVLLDEIWAWKSGRAMNYTNWDNDFWRYSQANWTVVFAGGRNKWRVNTDVPVIRFGTSKMVCERSDPDFTYDEDWTDVRIGPKRKQYLMSYTMSNFTQAKAYCGSIGGRLP